MEVSDMYKSLTGRSLEEDVVENFRKTYQPFIEGQMNTGDITMGQNLRF